MHQATLSIPGIGPRFSVGFGPKIWGIIRGGIEYQIAAIPLGGFVQVKGMSSLEEGAAEDPRSYINRPRWARFLMLAAGPGSKLDASGVIQDRVIDGDFSVFSHHIAKDKLHAMVEGTKLARASLK